jgi:hypothetical protein
MPFLNTLGCSNYVSRSFRRKIVFASFGSGEARYISPGTYIFTVPSGVTSVSVVVVGAGGGGSNTGGNGGCGGGLAYKNDIPVQAGQTYTVQVGDGGNFSTTTDGDHGETSSFHTTSATGGDGGKHGGGEMRYGGVPTGVYDGGGNGGDMLHTNTQGWSGGAGGYSGNGGGYGSGEILPSGGAGGAGRYAGGNAAGHGGGVGIFGEGATGTNGIAADSTASNGTGGSGGEDGQGYRIASARGGNFGGGGGWNAGVPTNGGKGGSGAVRIIWGTGRSFPSTNTSEAASTDYILENDIEVLV